MCGLGTWKDNWIPNVRYLHHMSYLAEAAKVRHEAPWMVLGGSGGTRSTGDEKMDVSFLRTVPCANCVLLLV